MRRVQVKVLIVAAIAVLHQVPGRADAVERALTASPGSANGALIGNTCPTFSWGAVHGARSYEVLVYRVAGEGEEPVPVLRETFAGSVTSWTPALDRCLERGGRYAWTVRAQVRGETSDWSAPSLFRVVAGPSEEEFREALAVVREYLDLDFRAEPEATDAPEGEGDSSSESSRGASAASPGPTAAAATALKVDLGVEAASFKGDGSELTGLDPANLAAGTAAIDISGTAATATDADTVDGSHASAFVPASGGLMTGTLTLNPSLGSALLVTQGNVGVGTASPASMLHIEGGAAVWPLRVVGSENLLIADGQGAVGGPTRMAQFSNGVGKSLVFMGSGRVGIGTLSPATHLEVFSEDTASLKINKGGSGGASEEADLIFEHEGSQIINYYNGTQLSWFKSPNDLFTIEQFGDIRVGTGTNGCVKDRDGTTIAGSCSSDARLKKDVAPLAGVLSRVTRLTPVHFHWRSQEYPDLELGTETQLGLIAQQVEEVFPELVAEGPDGFKRVRYNDIPIYLLQAIREQQRGNEALQEAVSALSERLRALED